MAEKIALLNAKIYRHFSETFETTNLLLSNGKLIGMGYIPDDDDSCTQVDLKQAWILPDVTFLSSDDAVNFLPFDTHPGYKICSKLSKPIKAPLAHHFHYASLTKETQSEYTYISALTGLYPSNIDHNMFLGTLAKNARRPIFILENAGNMMSFLEFSLSHNIPTHIIPSSIQSLLVVLTKIQSSKTHTLSVPLFLLKAHLSTLLPHLKSPLISGISISSTDHAPLEECLQTLTSVLSPDDVCRLLISAPLSLLKENPKNLSLTASPNFPVVVPTDDYRIKYRIIDGKFS